MQTQLKRFLRIWGEFNAVYKRIADRLGLTDTELYVYQALEIADFAATNSQLVEYTGFSKQTISAMVQRLTRAGLARLQPDETDGRKKIIALTEDGQKKISACLQQVHAQELQAMQSVGMETIEQINQRLEKLLQALKEAEPK